MSVEEAVALHRRYVTKRKRWARSIGFPYSADVDDPDPGELPTEDPENG